MVLPHKPHGSKRLPTDHHASRFCSPRRLAEARGHAPHPARAGPVRFKRSPAPRPVSPPKVSAAGFAPASVRLEGGGLSFSATRSRMDLAAGLPPTTRRSKRRMIVISPREEKSGPPARNCTWNSTFAESRDRSFTTGRKTEPRPRGTPADVSLRHQSASGTDSTSRTSASGSRSSFCMISNTRSLQPARQ